jgi:circadian clock protein KaiB
MKQTPDLIVLELFVQGQSPYSNEAYRTVVHVCETHLAGHYQLEVIDIHQQEERTRAARIPAQPALVRRRPTPVTTKVGRLSEERVLAALGLHAEGASN